MVRATKGVPALTPGTPRGCFPILSGRKRLADTVGQPIGSAINTQTHTHHTHTHTCFLGNTEVRQTPPCTVTQTYRRHPQLVVPLVEHKAMGGDSIVQRIQPEIPQLPPELFALWGSHSQGSGTSLRAQGTSDGR